MSARDHGQHTKTWEEVGHFDVFAQDVAHALIDLNIAPGYKYLYHTIRAINMTSVSIVAIAAGTAAVGVGALELSVT